MKKLTSILLSVVVFSNTVYGATPAPVPAVAQAQAPAVVKVFVTKTGTKYHKGTCKHLADSKIEVELQKAMDKKEPCKTCHTDKEYQEHMAKVKAHRESKKNLKK